MVISQLSWILSGLAVLYINSPSIETPLPNYEPEGRATLVIVNQSADELSVGLEHWVMVPFGVHEENSEIERGEKKSIRVPVQGLTEYNVVLNGQSQAILARPGTVDTLYYYSANGATDILFAGPMKELNLYVHQRDLHFGPKDGLYRPRAHATQQAKNVAELFAFNDSIHAVYTGYLESIDNLPGWYRDFERRRLYYINEGFKLNSVFYRNALLGKADKLPQGYLQRLESSGQIQASDMLGEIKYLQFLTDYLHLLGDPDRIYDRPDSPEGWKDRFVYFDSIAKANLDGMVQDVYLAHTFSKRLESHAYIFEGEWLTAINDTQLRTLISEEANKERLPAGSEAPYFYLQTLPGDHMEPADLEGKVVLINFWATWCRPCIQEFAAENELVQGFKNEPVVIVNICMDSEEEVWRNYVKKYELNTLNLFANENWSVNLSKKYFISSLPHSVLIDPEGKIITNKAPRASMGVAEEIRKALTELR